MPYGAIFLELVQELPVTIDDTRIVRVIRVRQYENHPPPLADMMRFP